MSLPRSPSARAIPTGRHIAIIVAVVLTFFAVISWAAGTYYVPYRVSSTLPNSHAQLGQSAVFVVRSAFEEKAWKVHTDTMAAALDQEAQRVLRRSSLFFNPLGAADRVRTSEMEVLQAQMPVRQVLVLTAKSLRYGVRRNTLRDIEWDLKLYEGRALLWSSDIARESNTLLEQFSNVYRIVQIMFEIDADDLLNIENSWPAKISREVFERMREDGVIAAK
jgi:hypothetical protein